MKLEPTPTEYQQVMSYSDANLYCFSLNIDGKTGWRLPTIDELGELYKQTNDSMWCLAYCESDHDAFNRLCWPVREMGT